MSRFPSRWGQAQEPHSEPKGSKGNTFLAECKAAQERLLADHATVAEDFSSLDEWYEALQKHLWELTRDQLTRSYHNGFGRRERRAAR